MENSKPKYIRDNELREIFHAAQQKNRQKVCADQIDFHAFGQDINVALTEFWFRSVLGSETAITRQTRLAENIERSARQLERLIDEDHLAATLILQAWPDCLPQLNASYLNVKTGDLPKALPALSDFLLATRHLIEKSKTQQAVLKNWTTPKKGSANDVRSNSRSMSAFELFVGVNLKNIFKRYFHRKVGISDDGPYVRFVMAVLAAAKIKKKNGDSYSKSSVKMGLKNANQQQGVKRLK